MENNPIRRRRDALGMTRAEMGLKVGVSPTAIASWENGSYMPSTLNWLKVAEVLGADTVDMLTEYKEWIAKIKG